jgi:hypothetical protein
MTRARSKIVGVGAVLAIVAVSLGAWIGCGGDACETLADEFANCGSSSASTGSGGEIVCTDKEKQQAQCVIDAQLDQGVLCQIKAGKASASDEGIYDDCYAN